ncbi:hypothetical protein OG478_49390 [Streptomyces phaeochromogenes]|uniref:hypothetical protein n=1 Tax=Streptomyces phaeochromogenes TaxID=1923 RepID=UPI00386B8D7B|nr:hypothetical protein OG478_49390 [Streptomyces phaeochromogenes]
MSLGRIRPAWEDVAGAFRGEAYGGAPDGDADAFGLVAPADGGPETADGEGVEDSFPGDAGG